MNIIKFFIKILKKIIEVLFLFPFIFVLISISKFIKIKFLIINSSNFASLIFWPFVYKKETRFRNKNKKYIDIITYTEPVSNKILFNYCKSLHKIYEPNKLLIFSINLLIKYKFNMFLISVSDKSLLPNEFWLKSLENNNKFKPNYFSNEEIKYIKENYPNIYQSKKIIVIHVRDKEYNSYINPNKNWNYHEYRNFDIQIFDELINFLLDQNYLVFRVGKISSTKSSIKHKNFFDLPFLKKDILLLNTYSLTNSFYFIGGDSGVSWLPYIFDSNLYYYNYSPLELSNFSIMKRNIIVIFQLVYSKKLKRLISFSEIFKIQKIYNKNEFLKNYLLIKNTSDELLNLFKSKDTYNESHNNKFWSLYNKYTDTKINVSRNNIKISNYFLNKYKNLII